MTKTTAHSDCTHPKTKAARALCRKTRSTVETVTTDYGTFEIKVIKAKDLKKTDAVLFNADSDSPFFSFPVYDAFQTEQYNRETGKFEKTDTYRITFGRRHYVPGDTEYTVAVDSLTVKRAKWDYSRSLTRKVTPSA